MNDKPPSYDLEIAQAALTRADPLLADLIASTGSCGLRLRAGDDLFDALAYAIVHQQLSGHVAARIHARLLVCCDARRGERAAALLATDDAVLLGAGLSRAKLRSLKAVSERVLDGRLPPRARLARLDDAEVVALLSEIPGVGAWTAQMLLMHWLGRPDVLPAGDLGVRKGLGRLLGCERTPSAADVKTYGERWRPWCSVASWYLWRAAEGKRPAARPVRDRADDTP